MYPLFTFHIASIAYLTPKHWLEGKGRALFYSELFLHSLGKCFATHSSLSLQLHIFHIYNCKHNLHLRDLPEDIITVPFGGRERSFQVRLLSALDELLFSGCAEKKLLVPSYVNCYSDNIQVVREGKGSYYTRQRPPTTIVGAVPGRSCR